MRFVLITVVLLVCLSPVLAQDGGDYRLREPTTTDYAEVLVSAAASGQLERQFVRDVLNELHYQGLALAELPYEELSSLYQILLDALNLAALDHNEWISAILTAYLREHPLDFTQATEAHLADYDARVTPVDFTGDGENEYVLHVIRDGEFDESGHADAAYESYLVAYRAADGDYHVSSTPLEANLRDMPHWAHNDWQLRGFADVNADGLTEWTVNLYGTNTGPGAQRRGSILILAWRDGQLVDIAPPDNGYHNDQAGTASWTLTQTNDDPPLELVQEYRWQDNWGCTYQQLSIARWQPEQDAYVFTDDAYHYDDTFACVMREAEAAMWRGEYATAARLYEQQRNFDINTGELSTFSLARYQYAQARWVLAYLLMDKPIRKRLTPAA